MIDQKGSFRKISLATVTIAMITGLLSVFSLTANADAPGGGSPCSYCWSASYYGCRVTITYSDGSQTVTDCWDYRVR